MCGIDERCRDACVTSRDCLKDQTCTSGTCADATDLVSGMLPQVTDAGGGGTPCVHATECPDNLVCLRSGVCGPECVQDKDCFVTWTCDPKNSRCTPPDGGSLVTERRAF